MRLSEAASAIGATHSGRDRRFRGCGTDSRTLARDALFIALRGPNFDGHQFVPAAIAHGAAGAMVEEGIGVEGSALTVEDTRRAMGELARVWRQRHRCPVVAVTGSNGKTTVKEMLASVLRASGPVLATAGNLNNDVGVPLTLFRVARDHRFVVIEMGANHTGEIARLGALVLPDVGIITQCAPAHLEGFGSVEAVARAKGELLSAVAPSGTVIINADDAHTALWAGMAGERRRLTFGMRAAADIRGEVAGGGDAVTATTPAGTFTFRLPLLGVHNVMNALAVTAAAIALDVPVESIRDGLERVRPLGGRLQPRPGVGGAVVIDDSYNANPDSLRAGLEVLRSFPGRRWLVLGDMAELGPEAADFHFQAGRLARGSGVERLFAIGELSRRAVEAFGSGGRHYGTHRELDAAVGADLGADVTVLVKGSRAMRLERVVAALVKEE